MTIKSDVPSKSQDFDKVYASTFAHWVWSDIRIPKELKQLITTTQPKNSLELGCGLARFSSYFAAEGVQATGVDFSAIAIEKAKRREADKTQKPTLLVGDVTNLEMLTTQFDIAFDVGCFHCLHEEGQQKYVAEIYRLLSPKSTLLIWALDSSPSNIPLHPAYITQLFAPHFQLTDSKFSRRRIIASHWYWLVRQ